MIIEDPEIINKINDLLPKQIRIWGIQRTTKGLIVENVVLQEFMNIYYRHLVYYHQNQNQY